MLSTISPNRLLWKLAALVLLFFAAPLFLAHAERPRFKENSFILSLTSKSAAVQLRRAYAKLSRHFSFHDSTDDYLLVTNQRSRARSVYATARRNPCNDIRVQQIVKEHEGQIICEADYVVQATATEPNDPFYASGQLWGLNSATGIDIDAPQAWDLSSGSDSVLIGVIDSGVAVNHPDLNANIWINPGEIAGDGLDNDLNGVVDDVHGFNAIDNSGNIEDDYGHGTHVAGTIGASGNNSVGVVGVNWQVKMIITRFLDSTGAGSTSNAIKCLRYLNDLRQAGLKVIASNNSWGSARNIPSAALGLEIERSRDLGMLFIAAAGNDADDNDASASPHYPASYSYSNVVSVAAIDRFGNLASYSNYGASRVHLAAPGSQIISTYLAPGLYSSMSGTSMSTPHVTGVAALIAAKFPNLSFGQLKSAILDGTTPNSNLNGKVLTAGVLNASEALQRAANVAAGFTPVPSRTPAVSATPSATPISVPIIPTATPIPTQVPLATVAALPTAVPTNLPELRSRILNSKSKGFTSGTLVKLETEGIAQEPLQMTISLGEKIDCALTERPTTVGHHSFVLPKMAQRFSRLKLKVEAQSRQSSVTLVAKIKRKAGLGSASLKPKQICATLRRSFR